ncbi:gamma-glutamyltransferase [Neptunicoccus cionae]|uniref:Glutathione hydrolase proenzyme n=1 Tax=Neptunicoccus cionae TaxID=2035344 RepID=A0A916QQ12_9RHOB|nr:gamma-glutamyltransferase [Amylibacter cionae]GGA05598.1 gamma-glutamyltransferase [Amylibacter cionae]
MTLLTRLTTAFFFCAAPVLAQDWSEASRNALEQRDAGHSITAENWMISAANPHAAQAGAAVLRAGGTAADAMVAVQAVLGLAEPQSSGLGGGAFLIWYDNASGKVTTLDGREAAPLAATPTLFQDDSGTPLKFFDAVVGGRSVGVPATPALMEAAHKRWGNSPWAELLAPAGKLASEGFTVSPRLAESVAADPERLGRWERTRNYFLPDGQPLIAGDTLKNPAYAKTLDAMAQHGADVFYTGPLAQEIVTAVQGATGNPGVLSLVDLAIYRVKERAPVCATYREYEVCGMGPPSSGGLTVGQILQLLEPYDLSALGADAPESWRLIGDASRLAFADRGRYMADSDFVPVPVKGLLDPAYTSARAKLLDRDTALGEITAGDPAFDHGLNRADDQSIELPSTSHFSIVDSYGNALSMTTTVENRFGSRLMAGGFILNNELTDFSFATHKDGVPIANRVAPGKRPRSSMSPTIVLKDGAPVLVIGSPGGSRIIGFTAQTIIAVLDWGMDIQSAISMPRLVNRFGTYEIEDRTDTEALTQPLQDMGFEVKRGAITSGLHGISIAETLAGGADPRREGIAIGE